MTRRVILIILTLVAVPTCMHWCIKSNVKPDQLIDRKIGEVTSVDIEDIFIDLVPAKESITNNELKDHVYWLADDAREGRMSGKKGNTDAAQYIFNEFQSLGLETQYQSFRIPRMNPGPKNEKGDNFTNNIIGVLRGKTDSIIVIGAHMDHIGYGPLMSRTPMRREVHNGADDNASGSAVILELAEAFSQMGQPNHTLVFVCFSAEEMGLIGAKHYVSQAKKSGSEFSLARTVLMVNFDMVGYCKNGRSPVNAYGVSRLPFLHKIALALQSKPEYTFDLNTSSGSGGSDHAIFGNAGVPYVFFHTGGHPYYHTPDDDAHRIDYNGMQLVARFAFELIDKFDKENIGIPVKMTEDRIQLDEIHDHGIKNFPGHTH